MIYIGTLNIINADPIKYFAPGTDVRKSFGVVQEEFGGSRIIELVLTLKKRKWCEGILAF